MHTWRKLLLVSLAVLGLLLLAGCGKSKFEGDWFALRNATSEQPLTLTVVHIEKDKQNKDFQLSFTDYYYETTKTLDNKDTYEPDEVSEGLGPDDNGVIPQYSFVSTWTVKKDYRVSTAPEKDGRLYLNNSGNTVTYDDKEGTLLMNTAFWGDLTFKKLGEKDISEFKQQEQTEIKRMLEEGYNKPDDGNRAVKLGTVSFVDGEK